MKKTKTKKSRTAKRIPNAATRKAMRGALEGKNLRRYPNVAALKAAYR